MYTNLQNLLRMKGISSTDIARVLNVAQKTAHNKISGNTDFYLTEARKVMLLFPEYAMDYVFKEDSDTADESTITEFVAEGV